MPAWDLAENQIHTQPPSVCLQCLVACTQHDQLLNQASNRPTLFTTVLSAPKNPHLHTKHDHPCSTPSQDSARPTAPHHTQTATPNPSPIPTLDRTQQPRTPKKELNTHALGGSGGLPPSGGFQGGEAPWWSPQRSGGLHPLPSPTTLFPHSPYFNSTLHFLQIAFFHPVLPPLSVHHPPPSRAHTHFFYHISIFSTTLRAHRLLAACAEFVFYFPSIFHMLTVAPASNSSTKPSTQNPFVPSFSSPLVTCIWTLKTNLSTSPWR